MVSVKAAGMEAAWWIEVDKVDLDMVGWKFMWGINRGGWVKQCDWQQTVQDLSQLCHRGERKFGLHSCQLGVMGTSTPNSCVKSNHCTINIFLCVINNGELRVTAINELDFFSTEKGVKCPLNMRSVFLMVMHSFVPCCRTAQPLVCDSSAFRHSAFVLFPVPPLFPPTSKGWFPLQVLQVVVTELLCLSCFVPAVLAAQSWGVVYQLCEHSLFHPHFILPQWGMCWQELSLCIYMYLYVICVSWSLVLGLRGVLGWNTLLQICSPSGLSVFKDRCSVPFSSWVL